MDRQGVDEVRKVSGIDWNVKKDELLFTFDRLLKLARSLKPTKRNILEGCSVFF